MIERIKSWFTEDRATDDFMAQLLAAQLAAASGFATARNTATFQSCLNLISAAASIAELSGTHSESLRPKLGAIVRGMVDTGESTWMLEVDGEGRLMLSPATVQTVTGSATPATWRYSLTRPGPSETIAVERPAEAVLAFRLNPATRTPWRGRAALEASNSTGALLSAVESQMAREAKVKPARLITAGGVAGQASDVEKSVQRGGIVTLIQAIASREDPGGVRAGTIKNESTAAIVSLHENLSNQICACLGVPPDLLTGASEAGGRESFRRFAASTIAPLLTLIQVEWQAKIGPLTFELDALRAGDISARARAIGSRASAFKNLQAGDVEVERALSLSGLSE